MKRTLAMLLALIMILSCLATATAEGGQMGGAPPEDGLETLVEQGVISEETLEAILEYMDEHRPEQAEGPQGGGQNGSAPQPPEGGQNGSAPQATDRMAPHPRLQATDRMAPRPTCPHRPA